MTMDTAEFKDALSSWASGVTIVACRAHGRVVGTTVSAFLSLSLEPPLVLVALGPNATVLPFLQPGTDFAISVLAAGQRRLATIFADPFPVGPDPFPDHGDPVLPDALVGLACRVQETRSGGDHAIIIAAVRDVRRTDGQPLVRFRRRYHALDP
jgi:flavin reductase (DIM6/NTAB) family NADH-FMN oxidoreductase RutF